MELGIVVGVVVIALLLGFVGGSRLAELNLELRERRVAEQRRLLGEATARLRDRSTIDRWQAEVDRAQPRAPSGPR